MHGKNIDETKIERNYSSGSGRDYEENNRSVCRSNNSNSNKSIGCNNYQVIKFD